MYACPCLWNFDLNRGCAYFWSRNAQSVVCEYYVKGPIMTTINPPFPVYALVRDKTPVCLGPVS